jgi:hypothetical protein
VLCSSIVGSPFRTKGGDESSYMEDRRHLGKVGGGCRSVLIDLQALGSDSHREIDLG